VKALRRSDWLPPRFQYVLSGFGGYFISPGLGAGGAPNDPAFKYVEVADAGHSVYFESPEQFNEAILGFLRSSSW
jgi:pimeloyl-ACP methyl ester carboxylesterase